MPVMGPPTRARPLSFPSEDSSILPLQEHTSAILQSVPIDTTCATATAPARAVVDTGP